MSIIAIVGSAIASTLLSKVFSSAIKKKDQTPDKTMFELMVDQFTPTEKTDGMSKTAAVCAAPPDSGKLAKPESWGGMTALEAQCNQPRLNSSSPESSGNSISDSKRDGQASLDDLLASLEAKEAANEASVVAILQRAAQLKATYGIDAEKTASSNAISTAA